MPDQISYEQPKQALRLMGNNQQAQAQEIK